MEKKGRGLFQTRWKFSSMLCAGLRIEANQNGAVNAEMVRENREAAEAST
jgi:hypothetical protein